MGRCCIRSWLEVEVATLGVVNPRLRREHVQAAELTRGDRDRGGLIDSPGSLEALAWEQLSKLPVPTYLSLNVTRPTRQVLRRNHLPFT
jgi:hypothetical protein